MTALPLKLSWRSALAIVVALLLCCAGWLYVDGRQARDQLQRRLAAAKSELQQAEQKLASTRAAADAYAAAQAGWTPIAAAGLLDRPAADAWLEQARLELDAHDRSASISLLQQQDAALSPSLSSTSMVIRHSFRLESFLLHEGRLTVLLDQLRRLPGAILVPRNCSLTRPATAAGGKIHARCVVDALQLAPTPPGGSR